VVRLAAELDSVGEPLVALHWAPWLIQVQFQVDLLLCRGIFFVKNTSMRPLLVPPSSLRFLLAFR